MKKTPLTVCVLSYHKLCVFEFGIAMEVFALPRPEFEHWYDCKVVAAETGDFTSLGGLSVSAPHGFDELNQQLAQASLIVVPGWSATHKPANPTLKQALQTAHQAGTRIASICSGVFLLAECGLLDNKAVTTHWRYAEQLQQQYPSLHVNPDVLYIDEGDILTSAGSAAGLDLCLHIVRQDFGSKIANQVARRLVLPAHREGGQAQYIPRPVPIHSNDQFSALLDQIRGNLNQTWSVKQMATFANLSSRTLLRRFQDTLNETPLLWLTKERLAHARQLLENNELSLERVASASGFSSPDLLRHHFKRHLGTTPQAYRKRFSR